MPRRIQIISEQQYNLFLVAINNTNNFINADKGKLKFTCQCGDVVTINGATSHVVKCSHAYVSKFLFLKNMFNIKDNCIICDKNIQQTHEIRKLRKGVIDFCSNSCFTKAKHLLDHYDFNKSLTKNCVICNSIFMSKSGQTCSDKCTKLLLSKISKDWWNDDTNEEQIKERNIKIGKIASISNTGRHPWNYELNGKEYLKHYELKDGGNSLLEGIRKSFFKTRTKPEIAFENILIKYSIRFKYCFFCKQRQFDFLISLKNYIILVEIDGDYWHKSNRRSNNKDEQQIKRNEDNKKAKVVLDSIKNSKKKWLLIRFWEIDVRQDTTTVENFIQQLIRSQDNESEFNSVIQEIKDYYAKNC